MQQISVTELSAMLKNFVQNPAQNPADAPVLIDVREPWEWDLARIDGAIHIPMGQIPNKMDEIDQTRPTVIICHHGARSLQVVAFLQRAGFDNLHNLSGGIDAWSREIDSQVALY